MAGEASVGDDRGLGLLEGLDALPSTLLALLALVFALSRDLDRKFARIALHFLSLNRESGEGKGERKVVQPPRPEHSSAARPVDLRFVQIGPHRG